MEITPETGEMSGGELFRAQVLAEIQELVDTGHYYSYSLVINNDGIQSVIAVFHKDEEDFVPKKVLLRKVETSDADGTSIVLDLRELI